LKEALKEETVDVLDYDYDEKDRCDIYTNIKMSVVEKGLQEVAWFTPIGKRGATEKQRF